MLKVNISIDHIDYENIADRFLPDLFKNVTDDSKWSTKVANELFVKNKVTNKIAIGIMNLFPQKAKDSVVFNMVTHNKDKIIESINQLLEDKQIAVIIEDLEMKDPNKMGDDIMKIEITLKEIDYNSVIENALPKILQSMSEKGDKLSDVAQELLALEEIPNKMLNAALDILPQEGKNDLLVKVLSIYKEDIVQYMNQLAKDNQIVAEISDINVNH